MSVGFLYTNSHTSNNNTKTCIDQTELDKLNETLNLLAQVSLTLRTSSTTTASSTGTVRRRHSRKRSLSSDDISLQSLVPSALSKLYSSDAGPICYNSNYYQCGTANRTPRRNSAGKVTKLTRHRPHVREKV